MESVHLEYCTDGDRVFRSPGLRFHNHGEKNYHVYNETMDYGRPRHVPDADLNRL